MTDIHPTALIEDGAQAEIAADAILRLWADKSFALIEDGAQIGDNVSIGPYCVVGNDVVLGDGVRLLSHVVVAGRTTVGPNTHVYPFASIGHQPQDMKYHGEPSTLEIGANNIVRENVTMNPGTEGGGMVTRVGNNCRM